MRNELNIFWFRRDLRLKDNAGLYHALKAGLPVLPIFIFDKNILDKLPQRDDARVSFLHHTISDLQKELNALGSNLFVFYGQPLDIWQQLTEQHHINTVFTNHDYEPYALQRDGIVKNHLQSKNIAFKTYKDHVIFERDEVTKDDGLPYTVFTPYSRKWLAKLDSKTVEQDGKNISYYLQPYPTEQYFEHFYQTVPTAIPTLAQMNFTESAISIPSATVARSVVMNYDQTRNFPALKDGTTKLGIHFRFGTISIRAKALAARALNATYLNELIWRDFYSQILQHFPHVATNAFRPAYERIEWRNDEADFEKWCKGETGYPIVDAGMRELNATGLMHNRVRMITASFLTKHLLLDWRWGEAYFAQNLLDFDLASNNGGWQWAMGGGTDAAPYFRIFNPTAQQQKFDAKGEYTRHWVRDLDTLNYPRPMVEHTFARERCLETYKRALKDMVIES
jgi:deoxyribodipyrimidine photo-lyase